MTKTVSSTASFSSPHIGDLVRSTVFGAVEVGSGWRVAYTQYEYQPYIFRSMVWSVDSVRKFDDEGR